DVLCSGHDPRGPEEKRLPFADSATGMAGAETLLALSLGMVRDELIPIERLIALLSLNPAGILGLETGTLAAGMPADLMVFDAGAPWFSRRELARVRGMLAGYSFITEETLA
ncbi:MAG: amidohydrolase family protein, partial [Pseudomonadota bacterium]